MAGILIVLVFALSVYTVFVPVFTADLKHLKRGLLLFLILGAFALVFLAGMV